MISGDWTSEEVEATVADYFDMLDSELRGREYSKASHRRRLSRLLNSRSDGAIERKHSNISAVLIELGFPCISGYKPLRNYQRLLREVVASRLDNSQPLVSVVAAEVNREATMPTVEDILASMVQAPVTTPRNLPGGSLVRESRAQTYRVDYLAQEAGNKSLGDAGEEYVLIYERARLAFAGKDKLADDVRHISALEGPSAGFDILSFGLDGREHYIEVKTTGYGPLTPFFVTRNELETSRKSASDYYLYRAFDFRRSPKLFSKQGSLDRSFDLDPSQYVARIY